MNAGNRPFLLLIGLALSAAAGLAGCEPGDWFARDLGAPAPPEAPPVYAARSLKSADVADLQRLEADLRTVAEAAKELEPLLIESAADEPTASAEDVSLTDPLAPAGYSAPSPSPELLALLDDPALGDAPEDRLALALAKEVVALRSDVERLRQQMDVQVGSFVRDLKFENARLRREVQRLYAAAGKEGVSLPLLPGGGLYAESNETWPGDLTAPQSGGEVAGYEEPPYESDPALGLQAGPGDGGPVAVVGGSASSYAVLVEWGRSPEEALNIGPDVSSLRGMIVLVPPGTDPQSLAGLGQQLRAEYDAYDNINITVFDNPEAADTFAKTNSQEKGKPVMRVSKFAARDEDSITVYNGEEVIEVPVGP